MVRPTQRREAVTWACEAYRLSERRACRVLRAHRSTHRYQSVSTTPGGAAPAAPGAGEPADSSGIPAAVHAASTRGVAGQSQADLPAVHGGGADDPRSSAQAASIRIRSDLTTAAERAQRGSGRWISCTTPWPK